MNPGHELAMSIRNAYWTMHRAADACLQPWGVSANQFILLSLLHEHGELAQRRLVKLANSDANTIRAMLVCLEELGLVKRRPHATDGRSWLVSLTPGGKRQYRKLGSESESFCNSLLASLLPAEADTLTSLLQRVTTAFNRDKSEQTANSVTVH